MYQFSLLSILSTCFVPKHQYARVNLSIKYFCMTFAHAKNTQYLLSMSSITYEAFHLSAWKIKIFKEHNSNQVILLVQS